MKEHNLFAIPKRYVSILVGISSNDEVEALENILLKFPRATYFIEYDAPYFDLFCKPTLLINFFAFMRAEKCFNCMLDLGQEDEQQNSGTLLLCHYAAAGNFLYYFEHFQSDVNSIGYLDGKQVTLVHLAAMFGSIDVLHYLHSNGHELSQCTNDFYHPIFAASESGQITVLEFYLSIGCDLSMKDNRRETIVHAACRGGCSEILEFLVEKELYLDNFAETSPLTYAVRSGSLRCIKCLFSVGTFPTNPRELQSAFLEAVKYGHLDITKFLLQNGADISWKTAKKKTALYVAIKNRREKVAEYLSRKGCKLFIPSSKNSHYVVQSYYTEKGLIYGCLLPSSVDSMFETPDKIVSALNNIKKLRASDIVLSDEVRKATAIGAPLFVSARSSSKSHEHLFKCIFKKRESCPAFIEFKCRGDEISITKCLHFHNHPIPILIGDKRLHHKIDDETINTIQEDTRQGFSSGKIRLRHDISISAHQMYNIRRPILKEERQRDQIQEIKNLLSRYKGWELEINKDESSVYAIQGVFLPVSKSPYITFPWFIDDTSCTNLENYALSVILTKDCDDSTQVVAFCLLENRSADILTQFFLFVQQRCDGFPQAIVVDRGKSQLAALKSVFFDVPFIFCSLHIKRNIANRFGSGEFMRIFTLIINEEITEEEGLAKLGEIMENTKSSEKRKFLKSLLNNCSYWLPSIVKKVSDENTTNRVEGFFGVLKRMIEHELLPISKICSAVMNLAQQRIDSSRNPREHKISENIVSAEEQKMLGLKAILVLEEEFTGEEDIAREECLTEILYGLPCKHTHENRDNTKPIIRIGEIESRWIRNKFAEMTESGCEERTSSVQLTNVYSAYLSRFERYFTIAKKSPEVREILDNSLELLDELKIFSKNQEGLGIQAIPGRPFTHPRKNCEAGAPKQRQQYRCSLCGKYGHNKATCPKKESQD